MCPNTFHYNSADTLSINYKNWIKGSIAAMPIAITHVRILGFQTCNRNWQLESVLLLWTIPLWQNAKATVTENV